MIFLIKQDAYINQGEKYEYSGMLNMLGNDLMFKYARNSLKMCKNPKVFEKC